MSKILVLGSNSPSGATFCAQALKEGHEVIATSRSSEKKPVFLPYYWLKEDALRFYQIDLNKNLKQLESILEKYKPSYIVNFASQSMVGQSWENPHHWMQTNVVSLVNLLEILRHLDFLDRYIHFSTPEVYGSTDGWIQENMNFSPSTPYASSRAAGDMNVKLWSDTYDIPAVLTRAANIYGEGQQLFRIIPRTILCCLTGEQLPLHGGGFSERAFIHCNDVSKALLLIAENGTNKESYHISPHEKISIRNLVKKICHLVNVPMESIVSISEDRLGKDQSYLLESSKIYNELGWKPTIELDEGILRTIDWCKNNLNILKNIPPQYSHKP